MTTTFKYGGLLLLIFFLAAGLRFAALQIRPMHTDEAVHGIKLGRLLENGIYRYDKFDYHGPTLNYFTLIPTLIRGQSSVAEVDELSLRSVTAFFGLAILLLLIFLKNQLGWPDIIRLSLFVAIGPMLVYFSRYYIMEILFVFFNLGFVVSGFKYLSDRKFIWIVSSGIFAGLMMATKETWVLFGGVEFLAFFLVLIKRNGVPETVKKLAVFGKSFHFFLFFISAAIIYITFFSSFFTWPNGITESFRAFTGYLDRAGSEELHGQPWWFYLKVLTKGTSTKFLLRADAWFLVGGIVGFILLVTSRAKNLRHLFYLFWGYSTIFAGILLSVLTYKTPWNFLLVYTGLIFLTGYTLSYLLKKKQNFIVWLIGILAISHLGYQSWTDNFIFHSSPANTFVYAHPAEDVLEVNAKVHEIYQSIPYEMQLQTTVIYPDHDYWPLPWYFRDLQNIGWQSEVDLASPAAPLIISKLPNPTLSKKLFENPPPGQRFMYIPVFEKDKELRPGAKVNVLLRKDFWDTYQNKR